MQPKLILTLFVVFLPLSGQTAKRPAPPPKQVLTPDRIAAKTFTEQGDAARASNKLDDAESAYLRAIHAIEPQNVQPETVTALIRLADLYIQENRRAEAVDASITAMQIGRSCAQKTQECVKPTILQILKTARLFAEVKDYQNAEQLVRQSVQMGKDGVLPPDVHLIAMQTFTRVLEGSSQPATAAVIRSQIDDMYAEGRFGPKPKTHGPPAPLADLFPAGDPHPAPTFTEPDDRASFVDVRIRFSLFDPQFGLTDRAAANLGEAIAVGESEKTVPPVQIAGAYRGLSMLLFQTKRRDQAIEVSRKMVDFVEKRMPPEGLEISQAYVDLGTQLINERKREEALARFDMAIAASKRCTARLECDRLEAQASAIKGMILLGDGEIEKAEAVLKPLVESGKDKLTPELFQQMLRDYINTLRSLDRTAEAQALESKRN